MTSAAPLPLSRDRILRCAVEVADRDGLDAASLRKVAGELGVHVTSLYNHVATKDALLDGLAEQLLTSSELPVGDVTWEEWVRGFVAAVARAAQEHPGAFAILVRRPAQGAAANATFESGLAAFCDAGFDVPAAYGAVKSVVLSVMGCCLELSAAASGAEEVRTDVDSLSWRDFPLLHQVVQVVDDVDLVATLADVLVAGFAAQLGTSPKRKSRRTKV